MLSAALAVSACVAPPSATRQAISLTAPMGQPATGTGRRVAILLPLNGPMASVGQAMLRGAQLSFAMPGAPELEVEDTGGTPDGAVKALRTAMAGGAGLVLGPLTGPETAAIAPVAKAAGIPVLAFTSDQVQAQPGVWVMGLTPAQQVRRLVLAAQADNKPRISAVVPPNAFGDALVTGLTDTAKTAGLPDPRIIRTGTSFASGNEALKEASGYAARHGAGAPDPKAAPLPDAAAVPPASLPMDALFLGLNGEQLAQVVPQLAFYDVSPAQVRVMGPATWSQLGTRYPALTGAWFAAPDPAARTGFAQQYMTKFAAPASDFSSLAFDAAGIARAASTPAGFPVASLTRPEGYAGANGLVALLPNGQVRRGLAIFEIDKGGAHIVQPAPTSFVTPGS